MHYHLSPNVPQYLTSSFRRIFRVNSLKCEVRLFNLRANFDHSCTNICSCTDEFMLSTVWSTRRTRRCSCVLYVCVHARKQCVYMHQQMTVHERAHTYGVVVAGSMGVCMYVSVHVCM